jgi:hypothetical protein
MSELTTLDDFLREYNDKCFDDVKFDLLKNRKLDINNITLLTDVLSGLHKYVVYRIKLFERSIILRELEESKLTDYSKAYTKFSKLDRIISRRCAYYTNRQWDSWRLYKETDDSKYEAKHYYYENKVRGLSELKGTLLNRTDWRLFEDRRYKEINTIAFSSYVFSREFLEFELNDEVIESESKVILTMLKKIKS